MRDYQLISPSLEGVLSHSSLWYEGLNRPIEIMKILDGPASKRGRTKPSEDEEKVLEQYFQDLYGVFLKKLSTFALEAESSAEETIKLQALFQEMIKVKRLRAR